MFQNVAQELHVLGQAQGLDPGADLTPERLVPLRQLATCPHQIHLAPDTPQARQRLHDADGILGGGQPPGAPACFDPKADRVLVSDPAGGLRAWPLTDEALLEAADALFPQELLEAEVDLIR